MSPYETQREAFEAFFRMIPHNDALGIRTEDTGPGRCVMRLPYAPHLVGDPDTGVLHGGAIASLVDTCSGGAVWLGLDTLIPIATLDLRIDYLRSATPGKDVIASAEVVSLTQSVAFSRCVAYHPDDPTTLIATGAGTFMLHTRQGRQVPE